MNGGRADGMGKMKTAGGGGGWRAERHGGEGAQGGNGMVKGW